MHSSRHMNEYLIPCDEREKKKNILRVEQSCERMHTHIINLSVILAMYRYNLQQHTHIHTHRIKLTAISDTEKTCMA